MSRRKKPAQRETVGQPPATDAPAKPTPPTPSDPAETRMGHRMDIERPASDEPGSIQTVPHSDATPGEAAFVEPQAGDRRPLP